MTVKKLVIGARFPYSVVYTKVLSRALNNRLKKVRDIIFSRAQKGFTNQRHIQEVLINVIEGIAHCKHNNIPACILSIDQAKAFDSVSHSYKKGSSNFLGSVQISLTFSIHCVPVDRHVLFLTTDPYLQTFTWKGGCTRQYSFTNFIQHGSADIFI